MKQKKPAALMANDKARELPKTKLEDWIDEDELKTKFKISDRSVDNHHRQGIFRCTKWGGRLWFHLPDILFTWEENHR